MEFFYFGLELCGRGLLERLDLIDSSVVSLEFWSSFCSYLTVNFLRA